jgi:hypothetical protein
MAKAHHTKRASYELAADRACVSFRTRHLPAQLTVLDGDRGGAVNRIDLLGGLLREYRPAA